MLDIVLSEKLLAGLAGWEVVKQARTIVAENRVLSSEWSPPLLRGVVQAGSSSYRAGLVIRRENDAENVCTCRQSREWGTLCPHSIAVGLHALKPASPAPALPAPTRPTSTGSMGRSSLPATERPVIPTKDGRRIRRAPEDSQDAVPLEIRVLLPPNLPGAVALDRITVFFEGRTQRSLAPLASFAETRSYSLDAFDTRLLDAVELLAGGDSPALIQVTSMDLAGLLEALVEHPRVSFGKSTVARVRQEPWKMPILARLLPNGEIELRAKPTQKPPTVIPGSRFWTVSDAEIRPVELPASCRPLFAGPVRIPRPAVPSFLSADLPALARASDLDADFAAADFEMSPQPPRFALHLAGGLAQLTAQLHATYGQRIVGAATTSPGEPPWMPDPRDIRRFHARDLPAERAALQRLQRSGFSAPDAQGRMNLAGQNPVLTFFARDFPKLEREWDVTLEERLDRSARQSFERIEPRFAITPSGEQWFELGVSYTTSSGEQLPAHEIQRLLRGGQNHTRLRNGRIALIDTGAVEELEEILIDAAPEQHAGGYRIRQEQAGFVHASLARQGWDPVAPAAWRERAIRQSGSVLLPCPPLGPLDSVLRPYQKQGVAWLAFLRENGFGGILADEMGLGKTLQALALLAVSRKTASQEGSSAGPPHLVVCPTSLVFNWVEEAARFVPSFRVLALHGAERLSKFDLVPRHDLVVTSYALVRRDFARYREFDFDTVILDEAQHIKNRQTRNAQAVKALRSRHRLVLTGTPLENSVLDLWSIFDFLMPGYLGQTQDFRDRYEIPITRERSPEAQARLARRIRPFLLRRLKRDVAPELPARIDQVVWCELSEEQAVVYGQLLEATRRQVTDAATSRGDGPSRLLVLTAILRLRQACCDLRLLGVEKGAEAAARRPDEDSPTASDPVSASGSSGKLDAFGELLEEVLDGGHRVLVFSQFTRLLGLVRERLQAESLPYCYLDGSTHDRAAEVARFQNSPDIPVFLISLKAGGVGLNLTAADTVVHLDPWWNPAVEDQATDRAHRIGQSKIVTSYKLITRGTIEEKILALQTRKRDVLQTVLTDEEQFSSSLSWDEIRELLG